jgi:hypothetical protein
LLPQFSQLFAEISPYLGDLLKRRRSGVMAAAAAAAGRLGANQAQVAAAIATALGQLAQWEGRAGGYGPYFLFATHISFRTRAGMKVG